MFQKSILQNTGSKQLLLILAFMICPGLASAQSLFEQADRDNNDVIDYEEFREHMTEVFYHADVDRDGTLEGDELNIMNKARVPDSDTDGDSELELREFLNTTGADFRSADRNRDNLLSEDEL